VSFINKYGGPIVGPRLSTLPDPCPNPTQYIWSRVRFYAYIEKLSSSDKTKKFTFLVLLHNVGSCHAYVTKWIWFFDTNIKLLLTFIFYHKSIVKQDRYMTHLLSYSNTVL
jgi:hypothetical protein